MSLHHSITDHVADTNHVIGWENGNVLATESHRTTRWMKEAIFIRRRGQKTMNKDEGAYKLHSIYDQLILSTSPTAPPTASSRVYKPVSSGQSCQFDKATSVVVKRH